MDDKVYGRAVVFRNDDMLAGNNENLQVSEDGSSGKRNMITLMTFFKFSAHLQMILILLFCVSGDYDDPVSIQSDYQCLQLHFWIVLYNKLCIFFQCHQ